MFRGRHSCTRLQQNEACRRKSRGAAETKMVQTQTNEVYACMSGSFWLGEHSWKESLNSLLCGHLTPLCWAPTFLRGRGPPYHLLKHIEINFNSFFLCLRWLCSDKGSWWWVSLSCRGVTGLTVPMEIRLAPFQFHINGVFSASAVNI